MKTTRFRARRRGFTLLEILIVVSILGLLVALAIPNFVKSRAYAKRQLCIENLTQIESAKQIWGVETGQSDGDTPTDADLFGPTSYMKERPECPTGARYELGPIGTDASCPSGEEGHVL